MDEQKTLAPEGAIAPEKAPAKAPTATQQALALVKTTIKEFDSVEAGLAKLEKKYANVVYDVSTTKGMTEATKARAEIRAPRHAITKAIADAKKPLNALKNEITARGEEITAAILALETPIDEQIKVEERRRAEEKAEREMKERARILAITERIAAIRAHIARAQGCRSSERMAMVLESLNALDMTGFEEFEAEAISNMEIARAAIADLIASRKAEEQERETARLAQEAESKRLADAQADLDKQREEFEAARAHLETVKKALEAQAAAMAPAPAPAPPAPEPMPAPTVEQARDPSMDGLAFVQPAAPQPAPALAVPPETATDSTMGEDVAEAAEMLRLFGDDDEPTDEEIVTVAVESIAGYFGITEEQATERLARIAKWSYTGLVRIETA